MTTTRIALIALAGTLAAAATVHAHAIYNLSGYGAGIPGSTNGADGSPTAVPPATWTNGTPEGYAGGLPVHWYCGMHSPTQVRTIQTGAAASPPNGSLLAQVNSYNTAGDPDLPVDRVLAVGGKSWTDPENENQGWGHGLDYGLIHFSPLDELVAGGAKRFTIVLSDDPTDGVAVQLAYAIYGGWDTNPGSVRHQTFVTSPSPVDNPLGSTGLTLLGYGSATAPGQPLSGTWEFDPAYDGHYTIFVAALGGVSGQYQLTVATQAEPPTDRDGDGVADATDNCPDTANADQLDSDGNGTGDACQGQDCQTSLAQCTANLTECTADLGTMSSDLDAAKGQLAAATADADGDGQRDAGDTCPDTPTGAVVDRAGCSQAQFCGAIAVASKAGRNGCTSADWNNDEPLQKKKDRDCVYSKSARACQPNL